MNIKNLHKVHFIGIGGIGMSGLAEYFHNLGIKVSGSDKEKSEITSRLEKSGIKIYSPHSGENIEKDIDLVIYTAAVSDDNPELVKSKELNINCIKRAKLLAELVNEKYLIAICGTHGKTTTTSMISKIFIDAKTDPILFVGGSLDFLGNASFRAGNGKFSIAEADEYDRSFLTLNPDLIVFNNLDFDHSDIYKNFEEFKKGFTEFFKNLKHGGKIIANSSDKNITDLLNDRNDVIWYGARENDNYKITDFSDGIENCKFKVNGKEYKIKLHGFHNVQNATASVSASLECGLDYETVYNSLSEFTGVKRRMELKYKNDFSVFDDYAHHPNEVLPTLKAFKEISEGRVITVFQPHLFSRTKDFYNEFAESLDISDEIYLAKLYPAREKEIEGVSSELILKKLNNKNSKYISDDNELLKDLKNNIKKNDTVVFMGAGSISSLCDRFIKEYV
ncbi:MAG: UDP-N-acetylmuramate--L-alanine ligase [Ignavibacteria bacterium]|nr:UDP-N-acetylmuramate--L-alanine ligase [Ignavibacteria bacterium]HCN36873.1 UDP-N-acetylmuramate--L-alanine ligase [Bacteroidota bacterium]